MIGFFTRWLPWVLTGFVAGSYIDRRADANIFGNQADDDLAGTYPGGPASTFDRIDKVISSFTPKSLAFILGVGWLWVDYKKK